LLWYRYAAVADPTRITGYRDEWVGPVTVATGLTGQHSMFAPLPREASPVH
jgi:hypothetical protein